MNIDSLDPTKDVALGEGHRVFVRAIAPDGTVLVTMPLLSDPDRGLASIKYPNPTTDAEAVRAAAEVVCCVTLAYKNGRVACEELL